MKPLVIAFAVAVMLLGFGCANPTSDASTQISDSTSSDSLTITEEDVLRQQHRPHEVEQVEAGKLDIEGNLIDPPQDIEELTDEQPGVD